MLVVETVVRDRREYPGGKPIKAIARDLRLSRKVGTGERMFENVRQRPVIAAKLRYYVDREFAGRYDPA